MAKKKKKRSMKTQNGLAFQRIHWSLLFKQQRSSYDTAWFEVSTFGSAHLVMKINLMKGNCE